MGQAVGRGGVHPRAVPKHALIIIARDCLPSNLRCPNRLAALPALPVKADRTWVQSPGPAVWNFSLRYCCGWVAGAGAGGAGAGAPGTDGAGVTSGAGAGSVFFLSDSRVLSPVVALSFFFFFFVVSPARPSGADCVCRSATSAESAAAGAIGSADLVPGAALGCFTVFARALKRVFSVGFSLASRGFAGVSALAV